LLNLRHLFRAYDTRQRSYAEMLPWFRLVAPGLVLNLDGSLLAAFEYEGLPLESIGEPEHDAALGAMELALRSFDAHNTLWTFFDKRRCHYGVDRPPAHPVAARVDRLWREQVDDGTLGRVRTVIAASYHPAGGGGGWFDEIAARVVERREPFPVALWRVLAQRLSPAAPLERVQGSVVAAVKAFERQLADFSATLGGSLRVRRLEGEALLAELSNRANPASPRRSVRLPPGELYFLDTLLALDTPRREAHGIVRFESGGGDRLVGMLSVKGHPGLACNAVVCQLLEARCDFTLAQMFRFLDTEHARKHIQDQECHYRANVKSPIAQAIEKLSGIESERMNLGMLALADDAQQALVESTRDGVAFGYHAMAVQVLAPDRPALERATQQVHAILSNAGYGLVKENVNFFGAFALTLPGAADAVLRTSLASAANLADLTLVASLDAGAPANAHLSEQRGIPSDPLVLLPTRTDVPERFSLHVGDVGHFFIVGPAGAGKTTLINFLMIHWLRYAPCRLVVLDKGLSNWITLGALGGAYAHLQPGACSVQMNPALWIDDPATRPRFMRWLEIVLGAFDATPLTPDEIVTLDYAVKLCAGQPGAHTLSKLWHILGGTHRALALRLLPWTRQSERYGALFDNECDTFALADIAGIEVGDLLSDEHLAPVVLAYLFETVARKVDDPRRPTLIYLEEAWYLLRHAAFRARFEEWIKTMRKHGACVGIATQSLADLRQCPIGPTLNDNIRTRIFLPNPQAVDSAEIYRDMLGLRDDEIEVIRTARQKREYYIVQDDRRRLVAPHLTGEILALTRSDARAKEAFRRARARGGDDWLARYVAEISGAPA
jgi:type IV secretory pathway VirB4 component